MSCSTASFGWIRVSSRLALYPGNGDTEVAHTSMICSRSMEDRTNSESRWHSIENPDRSHPQFERYTRSVRGNQTSQGEGSDRDFCKCF